MEVGKFGDTDGLIVTLDDDGVLAVNYLGTDPPTSAVVSSDRTEVNYEEIDEEHRRYATLPHLSLLEPPTRAPTPTHTHATPRTQAAQYYP